jgi:biopolymer transport protein ExbD
VDKLEKKIDPKNPPPPPPKPLSPNERIETDSKKSPLAPQPSAGINDRNLLKILVNREGLILIDDEPTSIEKIKAKVKKFITNNGAEPELSDSPQKAAIVIETEQETPYKIYTEMLDKVQQAYLEIRNASAQAEYGVNYQKLVENSPAKTKIQQIYPVQISIADPDRKNN